VRNRHEVIIIEKAGDTDLKLLKIELDKRGLSIPVHYC